MVHKPTHKVHSFRGLLADGGQDEINLERQNVNLAYRIIRFDLMPNLPGDGTQESLVKVYREEQTSVPLTGGTADFTETDLLAAAFVGQTSTGSQYPPVQHVIFDNVLFSRNIFVTHTEQTGNTNSCNYYIELEEVPVSPSTLMQIKLGTARRLIGAKMGG